MLYGQQNNGKFYYLFQVNSHHTDRCGHVRPSTLLRYVHEAGNLQFEATHPTMDELRFEQNRVFLLSKTTMKILRPLKAYEKVQVATWAPPSAGATFFRCGQIFDGRGELAVESLSVLALLDVTTGRFVRNRDVTFGFPSCEAWPDLPRPGHLRLPEGSSETFIGSHTVRHSETDINGHMNNTVYPDLLADHIPGIETRQVTEFTVDYLQEAKFGESFRIYAANENREPADAPEPREQITYLRTVKEDGRIGAMARFVTKPVAVDRSLTGIGDLVGTKTSLNGKADRS